MSVKFEDEISYKPAEKPSGMVSTLIKIHLAQNPQQANNILIVFVMIISVVIVFLLSFKNDEHEIKLDSSIDPETYLPYGVTPPE